MKYVCRVGLWWPWRIRLLSQTNKTSSRFKVHLKAFGWPAQASKLRTQVCYFYWGFFPSSWLPLGSPSIEEEENHFFSPITFLPDCRTLCPGPKKPQSWRESHVLSRRLDIAMNWTKRTMTSIMMMARQGNEWMSNSHFLLFVLGGYVGNMLGTLWCCCCSAPSGNVLGICWAQYVVIVVVAVRHRLGGSGVFCWLSSISEFQSDSG